MAGVGRIYIDTNVFITAFETQGDLAEKAALLLASPVLVPPRFVTSELTLAELLVLPYRKTDTALIDLYGKLLAHGPWLDVQPVSRDVLSDAAKLRAVNPACKLPDAIHLATARRFGCSHFLSADKGMRSSEHVPVTILKPDEATLASLLESLAE
ncbi:putative nucleic acid-binding protein [Neorhizobium huautlense]|uniref:Nucleic acid-binding protein n=1 Tax=Neorhizobium huautlense TaxID=67774 RepID=A0ABT9PVM1_9HYPH|nr:PIN domain-containing protein [Neorhizobium huautlense]MDP9838507.1 putative nucleic acid-binding protein [Neorhizobium huautlense]